MFHVSTETRKISFWTYILGSICLLSRNGSIKFDASKVVPYSVVHLDTLPASILVLPLLFIIALFITNAASEYAYYTAKVSQSELLSLAQAGDEGSKSLIRSVLAQKAMSDLFAATRRVAATGFCKNIIELVCPIVFTTGAIYVSWPQFIKDAENLLRPP